MKRYKAILFDNDQTLMDFKASERKALTATCEHYHIPFSEHVLQIYHDHNARAWRMFENGTLPEAEIGGYRFRYFAADMGCAASHEEINRYYFARFCETSEVLDGTRELLAAICGKYALYIVTNGFAASTRRRLENAGLASYFNAIFISEELGAQKPKPAFFEAVFDRIPFAPSEALLIGDSLTADIHGGTAFGLDTCFINWDQMDVQSEKPTYTVGSTKELIRLLA